MHASFSSLSEIVVVSVCFRFLNACCLVRAMRTTWTTIDYNVSRVFVLALDVFLWDLSNSQYKLVVASVISSHRRKVVRTPAVPFQSGIPLTYKQR